MGVCRQSAGKTDGVRDRHGQVIQRQYARICNFAHYVNALASIRDHPYVELRILDVLAEPLGQDVPQGSYVHAFGLDHADIGIEDVTVLAYLLA